MNHTRQQEAEARKVYEKYWDSYSKGDLETFSSTLDEAFELIGTSESEVCHSKAEGIEFYKNQMQETVGRVEMRNRSSSVKPVNGMFLVNETCDIYILNQPEWIFYSKIRLSTLLHETKSGWKVIQQHGSFPDMRVQEGETMAFDKISKENLELRDAIKRATVELENKNRELAFEAALENVRAVAMGMKKPEDMLVICRTISEQLQLFGVTRIRNIQIALIDEERGIYLCYQYFAPYDKETVEKTEYLKNTVEHGMVRKMLASENAHFTNRLTGKELEEFREHRKAESHFPDPLLDEAKEISYCFLSIGQGGLGLTLYQPMDETILNLFKRFHQVFSLAYRRFIDIQKAEAQAREAQIEAALEKVRSRSLAMHKAEELGEVITVVVEKLKDLDFSVGDGVALITYTEGSKDLLEWMANPGFPSAIKFHLPYFEHPVLANLWKAKNEGDDFIMERYTAEENKSFLDHIFEHSDFKYTPQPIKDYCLAADTYATSIAFQKNTSIFINDYSGKALSEQEIDILKRFSKVFEQAYIRFLDLQKAEAQAREAQIEAALERVRSRTMGMQKSAELKEVIQVVYDQFIQLNIPIDHTGFVMDYKARDDYHIWIADKVASPAELTIPYFDCVYYNQFNEAKEKGLDFFATHLTFEQKNKFYQDLFKHVPGLPEEALEFLLSCPGLAASTVLLENVCLYIENFSGVPYSDEENAILMRFGKVFQQTYTRFNDLQKAEAQAREAQIEAALERVRAQTMAMHDSEDMGKCVVKMFAELTALGVDEGTRFGIGILNEDNENIQLWTASKDGEEVKMHIGNLDMALHPLLRSARKAWTDQVPLHKYVLEGEDLLQYYQMLNTAPDYKIQVPIEKLPKREIHYGFIFDHGFFYAFTPHEFKPDLIHIIQRFSSLFAQTYRRYLDLVKAEGQAREAEIELALERVRARTMAMQKSDELPEASNVLFKQVQSLGMPAWSAGYCTWDDDKSAVTLWMSSEGVLQPPFKAPTTEDELFIEMRKGQEDGKTFHVVEMGGEKLVKHYEYMRTLPVVGEILDSIITAGHPLPTFQIMHHAYFSRGFLLFITYQAVPEAHDIFKRFANVFEQTYTRFLDLQKAEAQTREAQIEAALERVRSRSMAMHKSDELADLSLELVKQVQELGVATWFCAFNIYDEDGSGSLEWGSNGQGTFPRYRTPREGIFLRYYEAGQRGETLLVNEIGEDECPAHYEYLCTLPGVGEQLLGMKAAGFPFPSSQFDHVAFFKYGYLLFITYEPTPASHDIFKRFANVFEQTYTRFLDLQKAEAQAKESRIEAALEKVRSRSLAMHKSEELNEVVSILFEKIKELKIPATAVGIAIYIEGSKDLNAFVCGENEAGLVITNYRLPWFNNKIPQDLNYVLEKQLDFFVGHYSKEEKDSFYKYVIEHIPEFRHLQDDIKRMIFESPSYTISMVAVKNAVFNINDFEEKILAENEIDIIKRFARVFDQAYTRFLDLQKAEAQAREAQIEAALERVRSRTMAMQSSSELGAVAAELFAQMNQLVTNLWTCGFVLCEKNRDEDEWWLSMDGDFTRGFFLPNIGDYAHAALYEGWLKGDALRAVQLDGETLQQHYDWLMEMPVSRAIFEEMDAAGLVRPDWQKLHAAYFSKGYLVLITREPCGEEEIFKRFAQVFDQTYTRFLDLKKAEAQALEAIKRASVDRIRAEIASMRTTTDLERIQPLIWNELKTMGVPFIRCGVFIMDEAKQEVESFLSTPDGKSIAAFRLSYSSTEQSKQIVSHWRQKQLFKDHMDKAAFTGFTEKLVQQGAVSGDEKYVTDNRPTDLYLHFLPFLQGMIYVGNTSPLQEDELQLVQNLADAFSTAYARYEDFTKLEAAKAAVDSAMGTLKATQAQLVQQEKLASLGQLTAGIAHEIKNPLNFVNNFTEVSIELMEEALVEIQKNEDQKDNALINHNLEDIRSNLKKVHGHSTRANSIVNSMLMHSRSGTGSPEPTLLNNFIREYCNLAFHGMRAGNNPLNVHMILNLDERVKEIPIIAEDFSRVVLNICNNAFDAMRNTSLPKLTIRTQLQKDFVLIQFKDNGTGIPDEIKDKILQPFFTTKKGKEGTGLGLSITNDIVKAHRGELTIDSQPGEGAAFIIHLPI